MQRVGDFGDHPLRVLSPSLKSNKRAGMPGHNMDYTWRVDAGPDPKGPVDRLSLSGSMSEWWEEIENPYDFETDSPEEVAEKKEAGEGSKHKSWSDIHLFTPGSPTFGPWNSKNQSVDLRLLHRRKGIHCRLRPSSNVGKGKSSDALKAISAGFEDRQYISSHCRLCNWASNGLTWEESYQANERHEEQHEEYSAWTVASDALPPWDTRASLHDHECALASCNCICGCEDGPFCTILFGRLCAVCMVRDGRGDKEHGSPEV